MYFFSYLLACLLTYLVSIIYRRQRTNDCIRILIHLPSRPTDVNATRLNARRVFFQTKLTKSKISATLMARALPQRLRLQLGSLSESKFPPDMEFGATEALE